MSALVVDVADLGPGQTRAVDAGGARLLVCNAEGRFFAIENRCPHARAPLDGAALRGCILECPLHGGTLDVRDGSPKTPPIRRRVRTYAVRNRGDEIEIELGA